MSTLKNNTTTKLLNQNKMEQTALEWLIRVLELESFENINLYSMKAIEQAKEMEKKEKLKHQLFIGKVTDIIGFDKTLELLRECNNTIKC